MEALTIIIVVGLLATTAALLGGIVSMARGRDFDQAHSHHFMFARVGLQAITLLCLLVALYILL